MADTGLFVSMLEDGTQFDILNGNLFGYKGAIFENLIADIFSKMDRRLYYFRRTQGRTRLRDSLSRQMRTR